MKKIKTVALRNMKEGLSNYIAQAQKSSILVTKHGKPAAIVVGVEGHDLEDIFYMTNRAFWSTIQRRRTERPVAWHLAKRSLGV